jgi:hypothetical protein
MQAFCLCSVHALDLMPAEWVVRSCPWIPTAASGRAPRQAVAAPTVAEHPFAQELLEEQNEEVLVPAVHGKGVEHGQATKCEKVPLQEGHRDVLVEDLPWWVMQSKLCMHPRRDLHKLGCSSQCAYNAVTGPAHEALVPKLHAEAHGWYNLTALALATYAICALLVLLHAKKYVGACAGGCIFHWLYWYGHHARPQCLCFWHGW